MTKQEKLYIGNLSFNTTEKSLEELFGRYGTILSVKIIRDKITNQSRGFGFVELQNISDIEKLLSDLRGYNLDGRRIRVKIAENTVDTE